MKGGGQKAKREMESQWFSGDFSPKKEERKASDELFARERSTPIWNGTPTGGERREGVGGNGRGARLMAAKVKVEEANEKRAPFVAWKGRRGK